MIIGKFKQDVESYSGGIDCFALHVAGLTFSPMMLKQGGPDFMVTGKTADGVPFEIGAAWRRTSRKGKPYLSVKLDGPTLGEPINCALTRQPDDSYSLIWSRPEEAADDTAAM
jgi:uncharacterized protein (DUF736 family)